MKVLLDPTAEKEFYKLSFKEQAKVQKYITLFHEFGFELDERYLKKVNKSIWELRPKNLRVFILVLKGECIFIHVMIKKSQKITKSTSQILRNRCKRYL